MMTQMRTDITVVALAMITQVEICINLEDNDDTSADVERGIKMARFYIDDALQPQHDVSKFIQQFRDIRTEMLTSGGFPLDEWKQRQEDLLQEK